MPKPAIQLYGRLGVASIPPLQYLLAIFLVGRRRRAPVSRIIDVMTLETPRLILTTWESSDWVSFRPIATDPEVMRYITGGAPWPDERIQLFVEGQINLYRERGVCRWKAIDKETGDLAGFCGVGQWRTGLDLEIGWWLAPRFWGRGLASEAAIVALRDAFERVGLERVVSIAKPENLASRRIMEKIGMTFECDFESDGFSLVRYQLDRATYLKQVSASRSAKA